MMDESVVERHPRPFAITFCTADRKRDTGGEQIHFDRAVLTQKRKKASATGDSTGRRSVPEKRYPINIKNLTSGEIRKVRIELIEFLNGHPVL